MEGWILFFSNMNSSKKYGPQIIPGISLQTINPNVECEIMLNTCCVKDSCFWFKQWFHLRIERNEIMFIVPPPFPQTNEQQTNYPTLCSQTVFFFSFIVVMLIVFITTTTFHINARAGIMKGLYHLQFLLLSIQRPGIFRYYCVKE